MNSQGADVDQDFSPLRSCGRFSEERIKALP